MELMLKHLDELPPMISFVILFCLVLVLSMFIRWIWENVLLKIARKTPTEFDRHLFSGTKNAVQVVFIAVGIQFSWKLYGDSIANSLRIIPGFNLDFALTVSNYACSLFTGLSIIYLIWTVFLSIITWYETVKKGPASLRIDNKIIPYIRRLVKISFIVIGIMFIAETFNLPLSKVWAAAGIGSIAIALAAKDTFENIISGIIILFDRPFQVRDRIELADGTFGDVIDIGIRSTKIQSFDNTIYILPNAIISNQRITNFTYPDFRIKIRQPLGVAYGSDMEKVKRVLEDVLKTHPRVLNVPEWGIYFQNFGDSSLDLMLMYWISDCHDKFEIQDEVNMEIKRRFEEENIKIPFPQREVSMNK